MSDNLSMDVEITLQQLANKIGQLEVKNAQLTSVIQKLLAERDANKSE